MKMKEKQGECLICKAPLVYLETEEEMECAVCHKKENSRTRCVHGHYVCNECHMAGLDSIMGVCLTSASKDPVEIIRNMMALPFCHMHGPEHHVMVGAALLTAYKNAGGEIDLPKALAEMMNRGKSVPGGACGFWGACGAGISSGMFVSIISGSTPLKTEPFALSHKMTSRSLAAIGEIGGPRCCKRDSYLSILCAIDFCAENFGIRMDRPEIICTHAAQNNQCIGKRCPFSPARAAKTRLVLEGLQLLGRGEVPMRWELPGREKLTKHEEIPEHGEMPDYDDLADRTYLDVIRDYLERRGVLQEVLSESGRAERGAGMVSTVYGTGAGSVGAASGTAAVSTKPDANLCRFLGADRMGTGKNSPATHEEAAAQVASLSEVTGMPIEEIVSLIRGFSAAEYGGICTETPQCGSCPIARCCDMCP